jgi:hypothetical protein
MMHSIKRLVQQRLEIAANLLHQLAFVPIELSPVKSKRLRGIKNEVVIPATAEDSTAANR